jgi:hypothetical protein
MCLRLQSANLLTADDASDQGGCEKNTSIHDFYNKYSWIVEDGDCLMNEAELFVADSKASIYPARAILGLISTRDGSCRSEVKINDYAERRDECPYSCC